MSIKLIYTDNVCPLNSKVDISDGVIRTISEKYEEIRIQTNETATYQRNKVVTLLI